MRRDRKAAETTDSHTSAGADERPARRAKDNVVALRPVKRLSPERTPSKDDVRTKPGGEPRELELLVDGHRVTVEADREIVLRCGKASITLTRAGKIILRGTHVVSQSSGTNSVKGTQVRIN